MSEPTEDRDSAPTGFDPLGDQVDYYLINALMDHLEVAVQLFGIMQQTDYLRHRDAGPSPHTKRMRDIEDGLYFLQKDLEYLKDELREARLARMTPDQRPHVT